MKKHWYDYLWIWSILYFSLGFFNILFAWLGMLDFFLPLLFAIFGGNKFFCNHMCGRGQLYMKLGTRLKWSRNRPTPRWMYSTWFRYGFLVFFMAMFGNMVFQTRCGRRSSCFGPSASLGIGPILPVVCPTGWPSTASASTA